MTRISVRGVAVASATAVTAVGAVVGMASGSEAKPQVVDVAGATLLADVPSGTQAQAISDNFERQATAQQVSADAAAKKAAEEAARLKAAADAQAKAAADAAAAKAAADARAQQQAAAARDAARSQLSAPSVSYSPGSIQALAASIVGDSTQFQCFSWIVNRESGWDIHATNPGSGAYGLGQALPGDKMASVGSDWRTNPVTQIKWTLGYMNDRYGSPCGAQSFWAAHNWY